MSVNLHDAFKGRDEQHMLLKTRRRRYNCLFLTHLHRFSFREFLVLRFGFLVALRIFTLSFALRWYDEELCFTKGRENSSCSLR